MASKPPEEISVDKVISEKGYTCVKGFGVVYGVGMCCSWFAFDGVDWDAVGKGSKLCIRLKCWVHRWMVNDPAFWGGKEVPEKMEDKERCGNIVGGGYSLFQFSKTVQAQIDVIMVQWKPWDVAKDWIVRVGKKQTQAAPVSGSEERCC